MFCPNCGSEQLQGTAFCSNCGSELTHISNIVTESKNEISSPINTEPKSINQIPQDPFTQLQNPNLHNNQNIGRPQQNPNQMQNMPNIGMRKVPIGVQNIPNMSMQNMPNMGIQNMPNMGIQNMPNMGMQNMPNMGMQNIPNMGMPQMPNQQININIVQTTKKRKNKILAGALAILFGGLGVHKFYLGKYGLGVLYALFPFFSTLIAFATDSEAIFMLSFLPSFVSFIEGLMYIFMSNEDFQKKYI